MVQVAYYFLPYSIDQSKWWVQLNVHEADKHILFSGMKFKIIWQIMYSRVSEKMGTVVYHIDKFQELKHGW